MHHNEFHGLSGNLCFNLHRKWTRNNTTISICIFFVIMGFVKLNTISSLFCRFKDYFMKIFDAINMRTRRNPSFLAFMICKQHFSEMRIEYNSLSQHNYCEYIFQ